MELVRVVVITRKSQVVLRIEPNFELRFPICYDYPLANIKFLLLDYKRRLNVFLGDPNLIHARPNVIH